MMRWKESPVIVLLLYFLFLVIFNCGSVYNAFPCGPVTNLVRIKGNALDDIKFQWSKPHYDARTKFIGYKVELEAQIESAHKNRDTTLGRDSSNIIWTDNILFDQTSYKRAKNFKYFACVSYTFYVTSHCQQALTEFSIPRGKCFQFQESIVDWKVNNFKVKQNDDKDVILTWSPVAYHDECEQIYKILVKDSQQRLIHEIDVPKKTFEYRMAVKMVPEKGENVVTLSPCTDYFFTLKVTGKTPSLTDTSSAIKYTTSAMVPEQVTGFHAKNKTHDSVIVVWKNPKTGSCLKHYVLEYFNNNGKLGSHEIDKTETAFRIANLKPCVTFNISITTIGTVFNSNKLWTTASVQPQVPGAVQSFNINDVKPTEVMLSWTRTNKYPECVTSYNLVWLVGNVVVNTTNLPSYRDKYTVSNLKPCWNYSLTLTSVGLNRLSEDVNKWVITSEEAPGEVRSLKVVSVTTNSISINWNKTDVNFACATHYELYWTDEYGKKSDTANISLSETSYDIKSELKPCVEYTIAIRTMGKGEGLHSKTVTVNATVKSTAPGDPEKFVIHNINSREVLLNWKKTTKYPECVIGYNLSWHNTINNQLVDRMIKLSSETDNYFVSNLKPGFNYNFALASVGERVSSGTVLKSVTIKEEDTEESSYNTVYNCNTTYPTTMINMFRYFSFCILDRTK